MLTFATVVLLGAAPPSVVDGYRLLVKAQKLDPVLREDGKQWKYVAPTDELTPGKGDPVVDTRNGYIHFGYQHTACSMTVDLALYVAGARRFILAAQDYDCIEGHNATVGAWEFQGDTLTDVTQQLGELTKVAWTDFLDEKLPAKAREEAREVEPATRVAFTLPRTGTTVLAKLYVMHEPNTGIDQSYGPRAEALAAKYQRYQALELTWSEKDAKFSRGAKRAK